MLRKIYDKPNLSAGHGEMGWDGRMGGWMHGFTSRTMLADYAETRALQRRGKEDGIFARAPYLKAQGGCAFF